MIAIAGRRAVSSFGVICFLVAGCVAATAAMAETLTGIVVGVADGDTITMLDEHRLQHKIRLSGIDAPEKRQDFGNRSKQSLSALAYRQQAAVESEKTDRYGRRVGKVIVNGLDVNLEQVRRGMAWHYRAYAREQRPEDRRAYAEAEDAARAAGRGLWSMPRPTPPWEFRRPMKTAAMGLAEPPEVNVQSTTESVP